VSDLPRVYLVRHGETEWSKSGQHTGRTEIPLTAAGEAVAPHIGARLAGVAFVKVLSSPRARARRTAELAGFAPEIDPDLAEWDYGDYEGLTSKEIRSARPGWLVFRDGCPGGESVQQVAGRADRVIARLKALAGNVLIFSHGHFLRVLAARWVGQPVAFAQHLLLGTATLSILDFDHHSPDEPAISLWNDDRHLVG
jgi:broad specificity phosphatase PhoE